MRFATSPRENAGSCLRAGGAYQSFETADSCSAWCLANAETMALPAAPMNSGRFSAAQSLLAVNEAEEPWNLGMT